MSTPTAGCATSRPSPMRPCRPSRIDGTHGPARCGATGHRPRPAPGAGAPTPPAQRRSPSDPRGPCRTRRASLCSGVTRGGCRRAETRRTRAKDGVSRGSPRARAPPSLRGIPGCCASDWKWRVIWGGRKVIFVFQHHSRRFGLYYDILCPRLVGEESGGGPRSTSTILTKNRMFIPIPDEIAETFLPKENERMRLEIRCDVLHLDQ